MKEEEEGGGEGRGGSIRSLSLTSGGSSKERWGGRDVVSLIGNT